MHGAKAVLPVLLLALAAAAPCARAADGSAPASLPTGEDARPQGRPVQAEDALQVAREAPGDYRTISLSPGALRLSSRFGWRGDPIEGGSRFHAGVDIPAPAGATVRAVRAGRVVHAGWAGGYGNLVVIDHGGGVCSRYGHLERVLVAPGDPVATGQKIGEIGSTGRSTGPHLHYEVRMGRIAIDPLRAAMRVPSGTGSEPVWPESDLRETEAAPRWSWTGDGMTDAQSNAQSNALPAPAIR